ncbi:MAG: PAS domain S-box protein [Candidatus Riflebacteria bacterium]|nr:PAS domain S-box protein [Candidatus Riflebacteria bacterium]
MTGNSEGNSKSFDKNYFPQQTDVLNIVLDNITQGMVVVGPDYRTLAFNRHFEEIFQLPAGTVNVGVDFREILKIWAEVTGQDQQMLNRAIYNLDEPTTFEFEFIQLIKGELRWCRLTHNPLPQKGFVRTFTDITEHKQKEVSLREKERHLRSVISAISAIMWDLDASGTILLSEGAALAQLDLKAGELVGQSAFEVYKNDPEALAFLRRGLAGEEFSAEIRLKGIYWSNHFIPRFDEKGKVVGLIGVSMDISDQKDSEVRFRTVFENAIDGIMIADPAQKKNIEANKAISDMLGYSRDELLKLRVEDMHPREDLSRILDLFERQVRGEISLAPDIPMLKKDGSVIYCDVNSTSAVLGGKQCLVGIFREITDRKRAEETLRVSEEKFRYLFDNAEIAMFRSRLDGSETLDVNKKFLDLVGRTREETLGKPSVILWEDPKEREKMVCMLKENGSVSNFEFKMLNKQKGTRHCSTSLRICPQQIVIGSIADITERDQAEQALRQANEMFALFMHYSPIYVYIKEVTAIESRVIQASENFSQMIGLRGSQIAGKTMEELFPAEFAAKISADDWAVVSRGEMVELDEELNGKYYTTMKFPIVQGGRTLLAGYTIDITDRKRLEEQSLRAQKLESIGTLAGGIAHDFNNLLQGVFGYISLAKMTIGNKEKCTDSLEQAEKALHQTINLTNQLLTFSKGGKPFKKRIDLRTVIENSAKFMLSGSRTDFRPTIPEDLWQAEADAGQIGQVIQNIVLNADQAMPVGGTISITAANISEGNTSLPPGLQRGNYIAVSIQDTGIGIPEQYLTKIFDPYFTTKERGNGLGLATSYSIIKNHGGMIDVISKSGVGSTFMIYLPAIAGQPRKEVTETRPQLSQSRKSKVLVMDDEAAIRDMSSELLSMLGHDVEVARNGQEALEKYKHAIDMGTLFDIVILDLTIRGGMGGVETVQQLLKIDPQVKAIVSSGYTDDAALANYISQGFKACLNKPYDIDALKDVLNKILNS